MALRTWEFWLDLPDAVKSGEPSVVAEANFCLHSGGSEPFSVEATLWSGPPTFEPGACGKLIDQVPKYYRGIYPATRKGLLSGGNDERQAIEYNIAYNRNQLRIDVIVNGVVYSLRMDWADDSLTPNFEVTAPWVLHATE